MKTMMSGATTAVDWTLVSSLLRALDTKDSRLLLSCISSDEPMLRIGNGSVAIGFDSVSLQCENLLSLYSSMHHEIIERWATGDAIILEGMMTYSKDGKVEKSIPFVDILRMKDGKIKEWSMYAELSDLLK